MQIKRILVVCIGNICRSPMAEYFFKNNSIRIYRLNLPVLRAWMGHAADEKASLCMQSLGIDMSPHVARKLNAEMIKQADLEFWWWVKTNKNIWNRPGLLPKAKPSVWALASQEYRWPLSAWPSCIWWYLPVNTELYCWLEKIYLNLKSRLWAKIAILKIR